MKFCCRNFESRKEENFINFYSDDRGEDVIISYYPRWREYVDRHSSEMGYQIYYCPWCGTKLPSSLSDEWLDILEKEYGLEDPVHSDRAKVPPEFWTEEWWKKRNL